MKDFGNEPLTFYRKSVLLPPAGLMPDQNHRFMR